MVIQQHHSHSIDQLVREILADFETLLPKFVKVFPHKRVLQEMKARNATKEGEEINTLD